jgi:hypothetical protein
LDGKLPLNTLITDGANILKQANCVSTYKATLLPSPITANKPQFVH